MNVVLVLFLLVDLGLLGLIIYKTIKPVHDPYMQQSFVEVSSQLVEVSS